MAPAPYVAPPPPPPPPPPPAPERRRVSFSAESLFGFGQSELKPAGKAEPATFAGELRGTTFEVIIVEGHTDRLGSEAYNHKLSAHRAETVRSYLVYVVGLEADNVSATGKSESQPVTATDACKGSNARRRSSPACSRIAASMSR
jgi:OOP family OmpA-OmpF porin